MKPRPTHILNPITVEIVEAGNADSNLPRFTQSHISPPILEKQNSDRSRLGKDGLEQHRDVDQKIAKIYGVFVPNPSELELSTDITIPDHDNSHDRYWVELLRFGESSCSLIIAMIPIKIENLHNLLGFTGSFAVNSVGLAKNPLDVEL